MAYNLKYMCLQLSIWFFALVAPVDFDGNTEGKIRATEEVDKLKEQRAEEQVLLGPLSNFTTLELSELKYIAEFISTMCLP